MIRLFDKRMCYLYIILISFFIPNVNAQEGREYLLKDRVRKPYTIKISKKLIDRCDTTGIIRKLPDSSYIFSTKRVYKFHEKLWFFYPLNEIYDKHKPEYYWQESLFMLDTLKKRVYCCSDELYPSAFNYDWHYIYSAFDRLFYQRGGSPYGTIDREAVLAVIDEQKLKEEKNIKLRKNILIKEMYTENDSLYVVFQPIGKKINIDHYLFFWLPRDVPSKWNYYDDGNKRMYVFDKKFNLIREEELKETK